MSSVIVTLLFLIGTADGVTARSILGGLPNPEYNSGLNAWGQADADSPKPTGSHEQFSKVKGKPQELRYRTILGGRYSIIWVVQWRLAHKSKIGGWIIQEVNLTDGSGKRSWRYWEAWRVLPGSRYTIFHLTDRYDDEFKDTPGSKVTARARFYEGLTLPTSFQPNNPDTLASTLPSVAVEPNLPADNATAAVERNWWAAELLAASK